MRWIEAGLAIAIGVAGPAPSESGPGALRLQDELIPAENADYFGLDVDVEGDVAVVGAYYDRFDGLDGAGSAHVFRRVSGRWALEATLRAPAPSDLDWFGWGVSISGDTIAVSAMKDDNSRGVDAGTVFVFRNGGSGWTLEATLESPTAGGLFGCGVDVSGDRLVAGHYAGPDRGGVPNAYVFERTGTTWTIAATLSNSAVAFGRQVSVSGDRIAIGAMMEGLGGPSGSGVVFTYRWTGSAWLGDGTLRASDPSVDDWFGAGLDLREDHLIVSAPGAWTLATHTHRAFVFNRTAAGWAQTARFVVPLVGNAVPDVAIDFPRAIAGNRTFLHDGTNWGVADILTWSSRVTGVAVSGDTFVVGTMEPRFRAFALHVGPTADLGTRCLGSFECTSGFCVEGVCCDEACDASTCESCVASRTEAEDGTCAALSPDVAMTVTCRSRTDLCDLDDTCSPTERSCPDLLRPAGSLCRASSGSCDVADVCDGVSAGCPNAVLPTGTLCRAAIGPCDRDETCDGSWAACPVDSYAPAGLPCRPAAGDCDAPESCSGGPVCPPDARLSGMCRAPAGPCDVAEYCSSDVNCPIDAVSRGGVCRRSSGLCDAPERCDGTAADCPEDLPRPDGASCGDALACNGTDTCEAGSCVARAPSDCDDGDACTIDGCSEPTGECRHDRVEGCCTADADCDDGDDCTADRCDAALCVHEPAPCEDGGTSTDAGGTALDAAALLDTAVGPDGGVGSPPAAGCGCRAQRPTGATFAWPALLATLSLLGRGRRLRRRRG